MSHELSIDISRLEGRRFIIGRDGHIYINSPTVSQQHAEIRVSKGKIYLRDLDSTNGIYIYKHHNLVLFKEGYVELDQVVLIGDQKRTIAGLLAVAGDFMVTDEFPTEFLFNRQVANA